MALPGDKNRPGPKPKADRAEKIAALKAARKANAKTGFGFGGSTPDVAKNPTKNKPWIDALRMEMIQADPTILRKLAKALIRKAASGDVTALKEIGDRLDGRSVAAIEAKVDAKVVVSTDDSKL